MLLYFMLCFFWWFHIFHFIFFACVVYWGPFPTAEYNTHWHKNCARAVTPVPQFSLLYGHHIQQEISFHSVVACSVSTMLKIFETRFEILSWILNSVLRSFSNCWVQYPLTQELCEGCNSCPKVLAPLWSSYPTGNEFSLCSCSVSTMLKIFENWFDILSWILSSALRSFFNCWQQYPLIRELCEGCNSCHTKTLSFKGIMTSRKRVSW